MFRFENPEVFQWLIVIPVIILVAFLAQRSHIRKVAQIGDQHLIHKLIGDFSKYKIYIQWMIVLLITSLLILSWANPQWGSRKEKIEAQRADVLIALDISTSMLAEDVAPNRLIRAKRFAEQLISSLRGERIGLILFAGNAYLQMPLTADYAAAQMFLQSASTNMASTQGTEISEAVNLATQLFDQKDESHHALIIISDGESHDEKAIEIAGDATEAGLLIYTIGVGTKEGSFIPLVVAGREDFKRDERGNPVRTQFDDTQLKGIAEAGNGKYYNMQDGAAIFASIKEEIRAIEKETMEERSFTDYESYFQYFLFFAIVLLVIDEIISTRKLKILKNKDIFRI